MNTPVPMLARMHVPQAAKLPLDVQPKLDGLRSMLNADDIILRSRGGMTYGLPRIADQPAHLLPIGAIADVELYIHGDPLQIIVRFVRASMPPQRGIQPFTRSGLRNACGCPAGAAQSLHLRFASFVKQATGRQSLRASLTPDADSAAPDVPPAGST